MSDSGEMAPAGGHRPRESRRISRGRALTADSRRARIAGCSGRPSRVQAAERVVPANRRQVSTFVRAEQRLADLAQPTYDLLLDALRQSHVVHANETGWRIGRLNAWLWVFSSRDVTIYAIRPSRGHEVPEDILGPDFDGYLVGWTA